MASRTLTVNIVGDPSSLSRAFRRIDSDARRTEGSLVKVSHGVRLLGAAAGGAAVLGLKKVISGAADFEAQLDSLGAVSDASAKQMQRLEKQAMKAGAATKFSALDAAKAQTELAKGGLSLEKILSGGLNSSLALAAAGEMDLADAAATTANALNLFKLGGREAGHVADALATAAN